MKKKNKYILVSGLVLTVFGVGMVFGAIGISSTISQLDEEVISKTPEAILASAGLDNDTEISLPVTYYDQKMDDCVDLYDLGMSKELSARQFEWKNCGYEHVGLEQGMVAHSLGEDGLPVAIGGRLTSNKGLSDMTRWYKEVEGKSKKFSDTLKLKYRRGGAVFSFYSEDFYPLDEKEFSKSDFVNNDGHNHLFTMNFGVPFTVVCDGREEIKIDADDDTFVFIGNDLVVDMGGIHGPTVGTIKINQSGEVYTAIMDEELAYSGVKLQDGSEAVMRVYHADRDSAGSVFGVEFSGMNLNVVNTRIASGQEEVQVAYNEEDPLYVAPLGVASEITPDSTKGLMALIIVQAALMVVSAVIVVLMARLVVRQIVNR